MSITEVSSSSPNPSMRAALIVSRHSAASSIEATLSQPDFASIAKLAAAASPMPKRALVGPSAPLSSW